MSKEIEETINDRHYKYGNFSSLARISTSLKVLGRVNASRLDDIHIEALDMIFLKIARILNGDPNLTDNWHDIAGYARLVEMELTKEENKVK